MIKLNQHDPDTAKCKHKLNKGSIYSTAIVVHCLKCLSLRLFFLNPLRLWMRGDHATLPFGKN